MPATPLRVCAEPRCPTLTPHRRCPTHTRAREQQRGTRQQRGYGAQHDQLRAQWQRRINSGEDIRCTRCTLPLLLTQPWHLDHDDDREGYRGPSHATCNMSAGGKAAHRS